MTTSRIEPAVRRSVPLVPLLILFMLSGASALVYQVLWMRLLALVFGVTVHAASTVLAAFMAGLAFGSAFAGRVADRIHRPLRAFAIAEALVAIAALATPLMLAAVELLYVRLHGALSGVPGFVTLVRLTLSFAVLIVPTTLMGATLPLVVKSALGRDTILGRQVSLLYAVNTGGAILGALIAGVWLVPQLGIAWSFRIGALTNLAIAAGALVLSRTHQPALAPAPASEGPLLTRPAGAAAAVDSRSTRIRRLVLLTFAVSGFASFALEIVWFRLLVVLLRPTTYAFTVMLATVLAGIALGSWISTPFTRRERRSSVAFLATIELLLALTALASAVVVGQAGAVYAWAAPFFANGSLAYFGPMAITSMAAILPPALLMGVAFPVGIAIWAGDVDERHAGERVGFIYSVNVGGAVAGSLLTGFVLLPLLGSRATLLAISALVLGTGLLLLTQVKHRVRALVGGVTAAVVFAAIAALSPNPVSQLLLSRYPAETPVWQEEDAHATVSILRRTSRFAPAPVHRLYINGMHQASDEPGMVAYHRIIGTLPLAIHPDPRKALVIGSGGGATPGAVAAFDNSLLVDVVELSAAVVEATRRFGHINFDLLTRPNVTVRVDDGRNHMLLTGERYDVITADVILPVHAGAGNLYSQQYYRLMRRVLTNRGIALQWIGSGTETEYKLILRTFLSVFPHTTLWEGGSLLVGSSRPLVLDPDAFERKLERPESRRALEGMGLPTFKALLSRYVAGPDELRTFVGDGLVLTDDRPLTEYFLALPQNDRPIDLSAVRGDVHRHVIGRPVN
jgi:spermidine synthase